MPAGRSQDNSMLYAVVIFVALFIASTALAIVFYLKITDYQKTVQDTEKRIEDLATAKESRNVGTLAGAKLPRKSVLGTLLARYDELIAMMLGNVPEDTSAEAKLEAAKQQSRNVISQVSKIVGSDVNSAGLIRGLELLTNKFDEVKAQQIATDQKVGELEKMFDEEKKVSVEHENEMAATIKKLQQDANSAISSYESLKAAMQQSSDLQVAAIATKLDQADQNLKNTQQELLLTQAKLKNAESRITGLQGQLESIMPKPDNLSAALKPDGKIISVDDSTKTVIINLGISDHVYRGLTFAVYDKGLSIPRNGKGKANIEVFDVQKNVSVARITRAEKGNPIMADDVIGNLIWKPNARREFVVAGDFKFGDGIATIKDMIKRWGGVVADKVSITTNFIVLGTPPAVPAKPTIEEMAADPRAKEKYDAAVQKLEQYNDVISEAKTLTIPVFDLERFLDFIGFTKLDSAGRK